MSSEERMARSCALAEDIGRIADGLDVVIILSAFAGITLTMADDKELRPIVLNSVRAIVADIEAMAAEDPDA